jgi:hypothetical protein
VYRNLCGVICCPTSLSRLILFLVSSSLCSQLQQAASSVTKRKQRTLRGLQKNGPLLTPLNGFAFGEGSGVSFAFGNSLSDSTDAATGEATSKTAAAGGGFGGGVGYVNAANVGSAYGGGRGGGNVSSIESKYGVNNGAYTYALDGGFANTTFNGVSSGGGFGSGVFGGLFVLDPDQSLSEALAEAAAASDDKDKGKGGKKKDKEKTDAQIAEEAAVIQEGFYGSFGNTTGGGGGGFGFSGLYASGIATSGTGGQVTNYATANSGVNASASGFGFGGGKTNVGNTTASGGGFGGGDANGAAGGDVTGGTATVTGIADFNATGGGSADGGGAGFIGVGLNPADIAGSYNFNP